jgi:hypothetical protein
MAKESLVKKLRDAGLVFLEQFKNKGNEIDSAFWMPSEEGWFFYISTPQVGTKGPLVLYREIRELLVETGEENEDDLNPDDVYVLNPGSVFMRDMRRSYGEIPFRSDYVRNVSPQRPYIYKLSASAESRERAA